MNKNKGKLFILFFLLLIVFIFFRSMGVDRVTPEGIRNFILSFGWVAPIIFILIYAIRPVFFFPATFFSIAGGLAFGPLRGTLYVLVGASLGAYMAFGLSRMLGRDTIYKWLHGRFPILDKIHEEMGFRTILMMRLIPLFPFDAVSYGAGLTKIRFADYALATTVGIIPGTFVYNYLGFSLNHPFSKSFYLAIGFVMLLIFLPGVYKKIKDKASK